MDVPTDGKPSPPHSTPVPKTSSIGEDVRAIKEAFNLFKSSAFKLQIDALLPNTRFKSSHIPAIEQFLLELHTFLMSLPPSPPQHPLEASRALLEQGIAVPYALPLPTAETNWKVSFEKPDQITLVGSWADKLGIKNMDKLGWGVDLALEMPSGLFQEKDYLNGRFFQKKAFYLAVLASTVTKSKTGHEVEAMYENVSGDVRYTTLLLRPRKAASLGFASTNLYIRLIPVIAQSSPIALHRLSPTHCNFRIDTQTSSVTSNRPTPIYNTAILTSTTPRSHLLHIHGLLKDVPSFHDAMTLLRIWANQRGYCPNLRGCVLGFENRGVWWAALLSLLVKGEEVLSVSENGRKERRKALGRGLSSYQLFRAALDFLSRHNFENDPVFLKSTDRQSVRFSPNSYKAHHGAVFVDWSSSVNLLAGVPLSSLDFLQHDARETLDILDDSRLSVDPFAEVFLTDKRDPATRFDVVFRVNMARATLRNADIHSSLDYGSQSCYILHSLCLLLRRALTSRTKAIAILIPTNMTRPLTQANPSPSSPYIQIGLLLNTAEAFRLVDHGPPASELDDNAATEFRNFWGSKAELRRFKDGRIEETVVWDVKTSDERALIPSMIVRHVLEYHFCLDGERDVQGWQANFDHLLKLPQRVRDMIPVDGTQAGFRKAQNAFDNLVKQIKALDEELPLAILNASPVTEWLRYTSVFPPIPLPLRSIAALPRGVRYLHAMEIVLQFERSAKWPDDLAAIQKMKSAFFERLGSALMTKVPGLKASVVLREDEMISSIMDGTKLDIVTPDGWAFSARIWHDREETLLQRHMGSKNQLSRQMTQHTDVSSTRRSALEAYKIYTRRFIHAPKHHRAIAALCHRFPAYAGTARLVKRWFASHWLLGGHVTEEAVELLCASVFSGGIRFWPMTKGSDAITGIPGSKEVGFSRVVAFLKDWRWENGLFVTVYDDPPKQDGDEHAGKPVHIEGGSASAVWFLSTEEDPEGRIWTSQGPGLLAARRIKSLAKATWKCIRGLEEGSLDVKALFIHPTEDYDLLLHLEPTVLSRYSQNVNADLTDLAFNKKYSNLPMPNTSDVQEPRVAFDPARLLYDDLKRIYTGTLEFFYDPLGGTTIGAVWDPSLTDSRQFRVLAGYSSIPTIPHFDDTKKPKDVILNEKSILSEIQRLGEGIVKSIDIQRHIRA